MSFYTQHSWYCVHSAHASETHEGVRRLSDDEMARTASVPDWCPLRAAPALVRLRPPVRGG